MEGIDTAGSSYRKGWYLIFADPPLLTTYSKTCIISLHLIANQILENICYSYFCLSLGYFSTEGLLSILKFLISVGVIYLGAYCVRGDYVTLFQIFVHSLNASYRLDFIIRTHCYKIQWPNMQD